jgi:hypothetical protein
VALRVRGLRQWKGCSNTGMRGRGPRRRSWHTTATKNSDRTMQACARQAACPMKASSLAPARISAAGNFLAQSALHASIHCFQPIHSSMSFQASRFCFGRASHFRLLPYRAVCASKQLPHRHQIAFPQSGGRHRGFSPAALRVRAAADSTSTSAATQVSLFAPCYCCKRASALLPSGIFRDMPTSRQH